MYYGKTGRFSERYLDHVLGFGLLTPKQEKEVFHTLDERRLDLRRLLRLCGHTTMEALRAGRGLEDGSITPDRLMEGGKGRMFRKRRGEVAEAVSRLLETRSLIVQKNLRLVASIAHQFSGRGIDLEDLIQEGSLGLLKAIERFDINRGFKFSTYATWWIRQTVSRALENNSRFVRLPVNVKAILDRILRARESLRKEYARQPTPEEIGEHIEVPAEKVRDLMKFGDRDAISLDAPIREGGEAQLSDLLPSARFEEPSAAAEEVFLNEELREAMEELTPTEKYVLESRFGLGGVRHRTLKDIGLQFSLSRERIRQIESKALKKLSQILEQSDPQAN